MSKTWTPEQLRREQQAMRERLHPNRALADVAEPLDEPEPEIRLPRVRVTKYRSRECQTGKHDRCLKPDCSCPHHEQETLGI